FNAWGGKYPPYDDDDAVPTRVAEELKLPVFYPRSTGVSPVPGAMGHGRDARATVVMEGGSVDFNGAGTVLTTTDCLLNKNRNPHARRRRARRPAPPRHLRQLLLHQRRVARADVSPSQERPPGDRDPAAAPAEAQSDRHRLR